MLCITARAINLQMLIGEDRLRRKDLRLRHAVYRPGFVSWCGRAEDRPQLQENMVKALPEFEELLRKEPVFCFDAAAKLLCGAIWCTPLRTMRMQGSPRKLFR